MGAPRWRPMSKFLLFVRIEGVYKSAAVNLSWRGRRRLVPAAVVAPPLTNAAVTDREDLPKWPRCVTGWALTPLCLTTVSPGSVERGEMLLHCRPTKGRVPAGTLDWLRELIFSYTATCFIASWGPVHIQCSVNET